MKSLALLLLLVVLPCLTGAQTNPLTKKLERAVSLYQEGKTKDADEYLVALLGKHPDFGEGWDLLVAIRGQEYEQAKKLVVIPSGKKFTITTSGKDGKPVPGVDSLAAQLEEMMNGISPSKLALSKYMYTMRKAMLHSQDAVKSSMAWRIYNIDINVDSSVNRKALKYYNAAEKEYEEKNFASAAQLYRRAIEEQPDFYKAKLYLGDAFYASENYADAVKSFREGVERFPDQLEPHKYLCDAYAKMKLYDKALDAAIISMCVYPDFSMASKMDDAAYLANKKLDIKWTPRGVFPNRIKVKKGFSEFNQYREDEAPPSDPWLHYVAALTKAEAHCNAKGIAANPLALNGTPYLELFSWQEMLKKSKDASLDEARKMQQAGYLDCYVLVTCYHPDIYDQYRDFVAANRDKVIRYYKTFLKEL